MKFFDTHRFLASVKTEAIVLEDGQFDPESFKQSSEKSGSIKPIVVKKPWGYEIWFCYNDRYAGKVLIVNPGQQLSLQHHEQKVESWLILSGQILLLTGDHEASMHETPLGLGECFHIAPGTRHRPKSVGDELLTIMEVSTPELRDVVRHQDDYKRG
ncbi:MAG: cupin domain-containing protein [Patescibacteria group bacterium]